MADLIFFWPFKMTHSLHVVIGRSYNRHSRLLDQKETRDYQSLGEKHFHSLPGTAPGTKTWPLWRRVNNTLLKGSLRSVNYFTRIIFLIGNIGKAMSDWRSERSNRIASCNAHSFIWVIAKPNETWMPSPLFDKPIILFTAYSFMFDYTRSGFKLT